MTSLTEVQTTISDLLGDLSPPGTLWVTIQDVQNTDVQMAHGPFESFDKAFEWTMTNGGTVLPLFKP